MIAVVLRFMRYSSIVCESIGRQSTQLATEDLEVSVKNAEGLLKALFLYLNQIDTNY